MTNDPDHILITNIALSEQDDGTWYTYDRESDSYGKGASRLEALIECVTVIEKELR